MAGHGMSENDVLIEMRRLRAELAEVRQGLVPARRPRSTSYRVGPGSAAPISVSQLKNRVALAMLSAVALAVLAIGWLLYRLLSDTAGGLFDSLVPQPVVRTASALVDLVLVLIAH